MNTYPDENLGEQFNLEDYLRAQEKTRQVVLAFSKMLKPGINEVEAKALLEKTLDESGLEKRWHPSKMRIGPNTTKNFRDDSAPHILTENDIFFVDIGPVYYNHEGDYGETFTIGSDPRLNKLAESSKTIFNSTGATKATQQAIQDYTLMAFATLDKMNISSEKNSMLRSFGENLMNRNV